TSPRRRRGRRRARRAGARRAPPRPRARPPGRPRCASRTRSCPRSTAAARGGSAAARPRRRGARRAAGAPAGARSARPARARPSPSRRGTASPRCRSARRCGVTSSRSRAATARAPARASRRHGAVRPGRAATRRRPAGREARAPAGPRTRRARAPARRRRGGRPAPRRARRSRRTRAPARRRRTASWQTPSDPSLRYVVVRVESRSQGVRTRCRPRPERTGLTRAAARVAPSSPTVVLVIELGVDTFGDVTVDADGRPLHQAQVIRDVVEQGVLAEEVGLDFFGVGEHHREDFAVSAPDVVLTAVAARTERIRLGSSVTVLSSDDPVRVFQRFSTLDAISRGRAEVTLGRGSFTESFPLFGYDLADYEVL